jgi:hypothetical protein
MHGTAAPYLNVPEYADRPELDLASDIEAVADAVYRCSEAVLKMDAHEAEYCGADPILARLREVIEELRNVTGG